MNASTYESLPGGVLRQYHIKLIEPVIEPQQRTVLKKEVKEEPMKDVSVQCPQCYQQQTDYGNCKHKWTRN